MSRLSKDDAKIVETLTVNMVRDMEHGSIYLDIIDFGKCRECGKAFMSLDCCVCPGWPDVHRQLIERLRERKEKEFNRLLGKEQEFID